jgi:peptidoglycan/xylan/chitin deacetylase (PgdA/CDA1 family)
LYRWLRGRWLGQALILGYHRIAAEGADPYAVCVSPPHFAEQLAVLSRLARPISLAQLMAGLYQANLPKKAVVLTFDDGYADTLYQAKPLLARYQIPATVFVTTGSPGQPFWWDELAQIVLTASPLLDLSEAGWSGRLPAGPDEATPAMRQQLLATLYQRLLPLPAERREPILHRLRAWPGSQPADFREQRALTPAELQELAGSELITIGAHTVSHPRLADLPEASQAAEIQQSKQLLVQQLGRPVRYFSYPNGSTSATTRKLVQASGFQAACASQPDLVRRGSDRLQLPRFWVPDWDGPKFSAWLQRWLPG